VISDRIHPLINLGGTADAVAQELVGCGPSLTLTSPSDNFTLIDAQNGELVQDAPANPPTTSQQWTLTEKSG
jgi:hypothetical protein